MILCYNNNIKFDNVELVLYNLTLTHTVGFIK